MVKRSLPPAAASCADVSSSSVLCLIFQELTTWYKAPFMRRISRGIHLPSLTIVFKSAAVGEISFLPPSYSPDGGPSLYVV